MAQQPATTSTGNGETNPAVRAEGAKKRRQRSASEPRPAYFIIQVLDESGQPMPFAKERIKLVSVERDAAKVLQSTLSGDHPNAIYLYGIVPPGRGGPPKAG